MPRYSEERKEAMLQKMLPPVSMSISRLSEQSGISVATLYNWKHQAKTQGLVMPKSGKTTEQWSSEDKFAVVVETAGLNKEQLARYCREKGLYVEQVQAWKTACLKASASAEDTAKEQRESHRADKKRIKQLEADLRKKDKALAETAALLVLRKKANAIWGEGEDE
jgi:transposase-like protein